MQTLLRAALHGFNIKVLISSCIYNNLCSTKTHFHQLVTFVTVVIINGADSEEEHQHGEPWRTWASQSNQ